MAVAMPGMASNMDINGIIQKLMEAKKAPIERLDKEIERIALEREIWVAVRGRLDRLAKAAQALYDYTNPFSVMIAESSLKDSFTATASRTAERGRRKVQVLETASAHRIASAPVPRNKRLPGAVFTLTVAGKEARVDFSAGGTIAELGIVMSRALTKLARTSVTPDTSTTSVLVVESLIEGLEHELVFGGDVAPLLEIGLLQRGRPAAPTGPVTPQAPTNQTREIFRQDFGPGTPLAPYGGAGTFSNLAALAGGALTVEPLSRVEVMLPQVLSATDQVEIRMEVRFDMLPAAPTNLAAGKTNAESFDPGRVRLGPRRPQKVEGLDIFGPDLIPTEGPRQSDEPRLPERQEPPRQPALSAREILALVQLEGAVRSELKIASAAEPGLWTPLSIRLDRQEGLRVVNRLAFLNDNFGVRVSFRGLQAITHRIQDKTRIPETKEPRRAEGEFQPGNELVPPADARVKIDGIEAVRGRNAISDLIEGVTLNLLRPGEEGTLDIDHDYKYVQKTIYEFIELYNQTIVYLNTVTRFMTREEREELRKQLEGKSDLAKAIEDKDQAQIERHMGMLAGDAVIDRLKTGMGMMLVAAYPTRRGRELALLTQAGISTGKVGANWADIRENRGVIELDTALLEKMINEDMVAVAQLFGNDINGDGRRDQRDDGMALKLYFNLRSYVQPGNEGIIAVKLQSIERMMKDKNKSKEREELALKSYEERLRRQFASSETRIKGYRTQGRWLENQGGK